MSSNNMNQNQSKEENDKSGIINFKNHFEGTKQLSNHYKDTDLKIINNIRQFRKIDKIEEGYDEIFPTKDEQKFGEISNLISFIYPPKIRGYKNRIGFRYYKSDPFKEEDNVPYFTLVYIGERRFQILEKQINIYDNKGNTFFREKLNCLDIILNIIKLKLNQDEDNLTYPSSTCEILGFIYATKFFKDKIDNIEILDPFFPSPFIPRSMIECEHEIDTTKIFIEPLLYNEHASVLLFYYKKKKSKELYMRKNIILDMSGVHYISLKNQDPIFSEEMAYNIKKFPEKIIQLGRSCSIWFYSCMLYLLGNKITFPLDTDDLLKIIEKIYELFNIKKDINNIKIKDRELENIDIDKFISYKMAFKTFINMDEVLEELNTVTNIGADNVSKYQKIFFELRNKINLIELNYDYYYKFYTQEILNLSAIKKLRTFVKNVEDSFGIIIMAKKNVYNYKKNQEKNKEIIENLKEIENFNKEIEKTIESFKKTFNAIKYRLYTKEQFHKLFVDSSDAYLSFLEN